MLALFMFWPRYNNCACFFSFCHECLRTARFLGCFAQPFINDGSWVIQTIMPMYYSCVLLSYKGYSSSAWVSSSEVTSLDFSLICSYHTDTLFFLFYWPCAYFCICVIISIYWWKIIYGHSWSMWDGFVFMTKRLHNANYTWNLATEPHYF